MKTSFLIILGFLSAQASVKGAYVEASIENVPGSNKTLVYTYRIVNSGGSKMPVKTFVINVKGRTSSVSSTSEAAPANWTFMGVRGEELTWAAKDKGVPVGESSGILKLRSDGLPAIRMYRLAPSIENAKIPFSPPQDGSELKVYLKKVEEFKRSMESQGMTLAPVSPPSPFVPLAFIDILIQNLQDAIAQGLQKNSSATAHLMQKLKVIRAALENNNRNSASTLSNSLIEQLGFQKKEVFSPEVVALIKFNLQYLITRLG